MRLADEFKNRGDSPVSEYLNFITGTHDLYARYVDDWRLAVRSYWGGVEAAEHSLPIKFTFVQDGLDRETQRELSILANKFKTESLQVNFSSPGLTRNRGIERNSSDWIAFWDSDDVGHPIECYNAILEARHSAKVLIGGLS